MYAPHAIIRVSERIGYSVMSISRRVELNAALATDRGEGAVAPTSGVMAVRTIGGAADFPMRHSTGDGVFARATQLRKWHRQGKRTTGRLDNAWLVPNVRLGEPGDETPSSGQDPSRFPRALIITPRITSHCKSQALIGP